MQPNDPGVTCVAGAARPTSRHKPTHNAHRIFAFQPRQPRQVRVLVRQVKHLLALPTVYEPPTKMVKHLEKCKISHVRLMRY